MLYHVTAVTEIHIYTMLILCTCTNSHVNRRGGEEIAGWAHDQKGPPMARRLEMTSGARCPCRGRHDTQKKKKKEIIQNPMTKTPKSTEKSKKE